MRLHVRHETFYTYDAPVAYSVQRLYLTPQNFLGQRTLSWKISAPGIENALAYHDGYGNLVHVVTAQMLAGAMSIVAEGVVDVDDTAGVVRDLRCVAPDAVFLRQTPLTRPSPAIAAMAEAVKQRSHNRLDVVHDLLNTIRTTVTYQLGVTHAQTSAADAFDAGSGVCQDHAHIFIGAARHLGIPSRYVTGYLAVGVGATASANHAWAEALLPDLGWVGFDPANGMSPTDHYVRVAGGLDAGDIPPIRGSRRGGASEKMTVEVNVEIAQQ
jgi:transglutaminase-like putative cysteine protease